MASKSKRRSKARLFDSRPEQVSRYLENGNYKQALKEARVCFRQSATDANRRLLEYAYIGRVEQLYGQGQREPARHVLDGLLELGVTDLSVRAALPRLLVPLGMTDRLPGGLCVTGKETDLNAQVADYAVVRPHEAPASLPELRRGALQIRTALDALQRCDEATALANLKDIPRHSPFADWKMFVRGLAAYYRHDSDEMLANWERLKPDRFAVRIAEPLKMVAGAKTLNNLDERMRRAIQKLERGISDRSLLSQLVVLRRAASDKDWRAVLRAMRAVRGELRRLDPGLSIRLVAWLTTQLITEGRIDEIRQLSRIADATPLDPYWNRALAMASASSTVRRFTDAEGYWQKYLIDLENLATLAPGERQMARGLIWLHLAKEHAGDADGFRNCTCGVSHHEETAEAEKRAMECLDKCFELIPRHMVAYRTLADLHLQADRENEAAAAYRRALEHVPDDFEALVFLAKYHLTRDEPLDARSYAEHASKLKPFDETIRTLVWSSHISAARHYARGGEFERGRAEFEVAERLLPGSTKRREVLVRKAALEILAGQYETSRNLIQQALDTLDDPPPLWLQMTIESIRFGLPEKDVWHYEQRWIDSLKRKPHAVSAGQMCHVLTAHNSMRTNYAGQGQHQEMLLKYLRRCARLKWEPNDLRDVCGFLAVAETKLLKKFVDKGCRQFPNTAYFQWMSGLAEFNRGPRDCNRSAARRSLQRALELARESTDAQDEFIVSDAKRVLTILEEVSPADSYLSVDEDNDDATLDLDDRNFDPKAMDVGELFGMFEAMCEDMGFDPRKSLRDLISGRAPDSSRKAAKRGKKR